MQLKSWPIITKAFAVISMVLILSLAGCTKSTVDESEDISIFDAKAHSVLSSSLAPLPDSLLIKEENSDNEDEEETTEFPQMDQVDFSLNDFFSHKSDVERVHTALSEGEDLYQFLDFVDVYNLIHRSNDSVGQDEVDLVLVSLPSDIISSVYRSKDTKNYGVLFDVARNYVTAASAARKQIKMFIESFIPGLTKLKDVELPIELPTYLVEKYGLHKITIGVSNDPEYIWKIGLYYSDTSIDPEVSFFLSLTETGGKGRMFMQMKDEEDSYAAAVGITGITLTRKVEAIFDGTRNPKKFEFKYVGDRSEARKYAREHWEELKGQDATKDALTKIPEKIFLTVNYNQTCGHHEIYGASYHPGWALLEELEGRAFWNDTTRTVYMFKGKSVKTDGPKSVAKLALALPQDTVRDSNVWENDAVEEIFTGMVESQLNSAIFTLNDGTNDCPPHAPGNCMVDKGDHVYYEPEDTLPLYKGEVNSEVQKATAMYDCIMGDCVLADTSDSIPENPDAVITRSGLEKFVYYPPGYDDDYGGDQTQPNLTNLFERMWLLYEQCRVISYMVNPAFFDNDGLMGTYNAKNAFFYNYDYASGYFEGTSNTEPINDVLDISLDNVGSYTPYEIKVSDIAP